MPLDASRPDIAVDRLDARLTWPQPLGATTTHVVSYALRASTCTTYVRAEIRVRVAFRPEVLGVTMQRLTNAHRVHGRLVYDDDDNDDGRRHENGSRVDGVSLPLLLEVGYEANAHLTYK